MKKATTLILAVLVAAATALAGPRVDIQRIRGEYRLTLRGAVGLEGAEFTISHPPAALGTAAVIGIAEGCALVQRRLNETSFRVALACPLPVTGSGPVLRFGLSGQPRDVRVTACSINERPC